MEDDGNDQQRKKLKDEGKKGELLEQRGPSCEQEGKEPSAQREGLPLGAWAGQEKSRAVPGMQTWWAGYGGGEHGKVHSVSFSFLSDIYVKQVCSWGWIAQMREGVRDLKSE